MLIFKAELVINLEKSRQKDMKLTKGERIFVVISRWFWSAVLGAMTVWAYVFDDWSDYKSRVHAT
ncbi:hypothetical protein OBV_20660 [Oscillibacter valericigenes Sjm18-20]|nr:hypothetical protein OBV_20660 [Oscillibacter valericigenes Sjm18-20]